MIEVQDDLDDHQDQPLAGNNVLYEHPLAEDSVLHDDLYLSTSSSCATSGSETSVESDGPSVSNETNMSKEVIATETPSTNSSLDSVLIISIGGDA